MTLNSPVASQQEGLWFESQSDGPFCVKPDNKQLNLSSYCVCQSQYDCGVKAMCSDSGSLLSTKSLSKKTPEQQGVNSSLWQGIRKWQTLRGNQYKQCGEPAAGAASGRESEQSRWPLLFLCSATSNSLVTSPRGYDTYRTNWSWHNGRRSATDVAELNKSICGSLEELGEGMREMAIIR